MRSVVSLAALLLVSSVSFGSTTEPRVCHVQINMSAGSIPQNTKLQVFAADRRLSEMKIPFDGSLFLPPLAPGEYRVQTGQGASPRFNAENWKRRNGTFSKWRGLTPSYRVPITCSA